MWERFLPAKAVGQRGQRKGLCWWRLTPSWLLVLIAKKRRRLGYYDPMTLYLFRLALRRRPSLQTVLAYGLFRRDRGYPLSSLFAQRLASLANKANRSEAFLVQALLEEVGQRNAFTQQVSQLPSALTRLRENQSDWRQNFHAYIRSRQRLLVVGNAPITETVPPLTEGVGIIRFNHYRGRDKAVESPLSVWVASAECSDTPPDVPWVIVSGPDMCFRRHNWHQFDDRLKQNRPVLTVPLHVWRDLVAELQAPPSAGLLILAWLRWIRKGWHGLVLKGFTSAQGQQYHHHLQQKKAGGRHAWEKEQRLLCCWEREGLKR